MEFCEPIFYVQSVSCIVQSTGDYASARGSLCRLNGLPSRPDILLYRPRCFIGKWALCVSKRDCCIGDYLSLSLADIECPTIIGHSISARAHSFTERGPPVLASVPPVLVKWSPNRLEGVLYQHEGLLYPSLYQSLRLPASTREPFISAPGPLRRASALVSRPESSWLSLSAPSQISGVSIRLRTNQF